MTEGQRRAPGESKKPHFGGFFACGSLSTTGIPLALKVGARGPLPAPHEGPGRVRIFRRPVPKTQPMLSSTTRQRISQPYMWAVISLGAVACAFTVTQLRPSGLGMRFILIGLVTLA